jgi:hypothetical protein
MDIPSLPNSIAIPRLPEGGVLRLDRLAIREQLGAVATDADIQTIARDEGMIMGRDAPHISTYILSGQEYLDPLGQYDFTIGSNLTHFLLRVGCPDYQPLGNRFLMPQARAALIWALLGGRAAAHQDDFSEQLVAGLIPGLEAERDLHSFYETTMVMDRPPLMLAGAGLVAILAGYDLLSRRLGLPSE